MLERQVPHPASTISEQSAQFETQKVLKKNQVNYIDDNIGVHKMINLRTDSAVTLHIYLPAYEQCRIFHPTMDGAKMGAFNLARSQSIDVTFFSQNVSP